MVSMVVACIADFNDKGGPGVPGDTDDTDHRGDTGAPGLPNDPLGWESVGVEFLGGELCNDQVPPARIFAQAAYFHVKQPIEVPRPEQPYVQRGFVVAGGKAAKPNGGRQVLSDLWVYDLSTLAPTKRCPWVKISDQAWAVGGVHSGTLTTIDDDGMIQIGGIRTHGGSGSTHPSDDWNGAAEGFASKGVYRLDLRDLVAGFQPLDAAGSGPELGVVTDFEAVADPDAECGMGEPAAEVDCIEVGGGCNLEGWVTFDRCTLDATFHDGCQSMTPVARRSWVQGCQDDPGCRSASIQDHITVEGRGLSGHGATYDPVSDTVEVFGGATGCKGVGDDCDSWDDFHALEAYLPDDFPDVYGHHIWTALRLGRPGRFEHTRWCR